METGETPSRSVATVETEDLLHLARRLRWDASTLALMLDELRAKADAAIAAAEAARKPRPDAD